MQNSNENTKPVEIGNSVFDFTLPDLQGQSHSSRAVRQERLLLIAIISTRCGTCKYAMPFLQRFHTEYALKSNARFTFWLVSVHDAEKTQAFLNEYGASDLPTLIDTEKQTPVNYRITNVPSLYLLGETDKVLDSLHGQFNAEAFNRMAQTIAKRIEVEYLPVVRPTDNAATLRPG